MGLDLLQLALDGGELLIERQDVVQAVRLAQQGEQALVLRLQRSNLRLRVNVIIGYIWSQFPEDSAVYRHSCGIVQQILLHLGVERCLDRDLHGDVIDTVALVGIVLPHRRGFGVGSHDPGQDRGRCRSGVFHLEGHLQRLDKVGRPAIPGAGVVAGRCVARRAARRVARCVA